MWRQLAYSVEQIPKTFILTKPITVLITYTYRISIVLGTRLGCARFPGIGDQSELKTRILSKIKSKSKVEKERENGDYQ